MAIVRGARPTHHYTQIRNDVLRDTRLSYRARGILAVLLSHDEGWSTSSDALARAGTEGRDAIRTALTELEDCGYLRRERRQDSAGRWTTQAVIYDEPQPVQANLDLDIPAGRTDDGKPGVGQPTPGKPASVSQAIRTEHQLEHPPYGRGGDESHAAPQAAESKAEDRIAKAVYDHTEGMTRYLAVRQVAAKALKVKGATEAKVQAALIALYDEGRPLTLNTLGQRLAGKDGSKTSAMAIPHQHWANGGQFTDELTGPRQGSALP